VNKPDLIATLFKKENLLEKEFANLWLILFEEGDENV